MKSFHPFRTAILSTAAMVFAMIPFSRGNTLYVDAHNATPPDPYASFTDWNRAATNIQEAIDEATAGDTILVRQGRYRAGTYAVFGDNATSVVNVTLPVTLRAVDGREVTLIDGQGTNRGIRIAYGQASPPFVLDGFMVTNCFVTDFGAGAFHANGNNEIQYLNSLFVDNVSAGYGAGISDNVGSTMVVSNSVFLRNRNDPGDRYSAAIFKNQGAIELYDSHFEENVANDSAPDGTRGGAMWVRDGRIENTVFLNNSSTLHGGSQDGGGGVFQLSGHLILRNCLFAGNIGHRNGGYMNNGGSADIVNCTFYDNECVSGLGEGGILLRSSSAVVGIHNSIIYSNFLYDTSDIRNVNASYVAVDSFTHNCTEPSSEHPGGETGFFADHNLTNAPLLLAPGNGDFSLHRDSPCIDAGTNMLWMTDGIDLAGNRRIDGTFNQVDIGCYEYQYAGTAIMIQ